MKILLVLGVVTLPLFLGWFAGRIRAFKTDGLDMRLVNRNHRDMARWIEREMQTGLVTSSQAKDAEILLTNYLGKANRSEQ